MPLGVPMCCIWLSAGLSGQMGPPVVSQCWLRDYMLHGWSYHQAFCWVGLKSMLCNRVGPLAVLLAYARLQDVFSNRTEP